MGLLRPNSAAAPYFSISRSFVINIKRAGDHPPEFEGGSVSSWVSRPSTYHSIYVPECGCLRSTICLRNVSHVSETFLLSSDPYIPPHILVCLLM